MAVDAGSTPQPQPWRQTAAAAGAGVVDLTIDGMSCAACVGRVERALKKVPGVAEASVNLATNQARVRLASAVEAAQGAEGAEGAEVAAATSSAGVGWPSADLLLRAVAEAGYDARLKDEEALADSPSGHAARWRGFAPVALALALSAPLVAPMLLAPFGLHWMLPPWAQALLAAPVQFLIGARFYRAAWAQLRHGAPGMDLLVALGTSAGYGLSLWLWLGADASGHAAHGAAAAPHLYFEASAVVIALVRLGKWLEERARAQAADAIRALERLRPERAHLLRAGGLPEVDVPVGSLRAGDRLSIRPGERVPADALVLEGESALDESMLTGEPLPVPKAAGATVSAGTLNGEGRLTVQVRAAGADTVLAGIIRLVEDAQAAKPPIQRLVDRVAAVFVPAVLTLALLTLAGWLLVAGSTLETALVHAVTVLVIACPCALGLATPAAIITGTGAAARAGILVRDAAVLERAGQVRAVAFDKTGTLTEGRPTLVDWCATEGEDRALLAAQACALQAASEHPLAQALRSGLAPVVADAAPALAARHVQALPGKGVIGVIGVNGVPPQANYGNTASKKEADIELTIVSLAHARTLLAEDHWPAALAGQAQHWAAAGHSLALLLSRPLPAVADTAPTEAPGPAGHPAPAPANASAPAPANASAPASADAPTPATVNAAAPAPDSLQVPAPVGAQAPARWAARALFAFDDTLKPGAAQAVAALKAQGLRVLMLSGDHEAAARRVARQVGIDEVCAGLLPQHKLERLAALREELQRSDPAARVAMAGDGINDAPALAAADLGLAFAPAGAAQGGGAATVAMHAAGITLLRADPRLVPAALSISQRTLAAIRQNLAFAFGYNLIGLPLAMFGAVGPVFAGAAMAASSVSVMANALRLARWRAA